MAEAGEIRYSALHAWYRNCAVIEKSEADTRISCACHEREHLAPAVILLTVAGGDTVVLACGYANKFSVESFPLRMGSTTL